MSVRTYNPSVRVGNWNEDIALEEDVLKDFLYKKENGELLVQKTHNLLQTILKPLPLPASQDGLLRFGDKICLLHIPTRTLVSAYMSTYAAHEATCLQPSSPLASAQSLEPCTRNMFVINRYEAQSNEDGDVVKYGEKVTLTTLPDGVGGGLFLHSERATFMKCSKNSRQQEVLLMNTPSYDVAWRFLCFDPNERLETEGQPVLVNKKLFVNHCKTNQHLSVLTEFHHKTPFGREYEVTANTKLNPHKAEELNNHFVVVMGSPAEVADSFQEYK